MKAPLSAMAVGALTMLSLAASCSSSSGSTAPLADASADGAGGDAAMPNPDGGSTDSPASGDVALDVPSDAKDCGNPGDPGNSKGVGKYCMASTDCPSTAPICSVIGDATTHFCTTICMMPDSGIECGENATCACGNGGCGCTPNTCL